VGAVADGEHRYDQVTDGNLDIVLVEEEPAGLGEQSADVEGTRSRGPSGLSAIKILTSSAIGTIRQRYRNNKTICVNVNIVSAVQWLSA
jgi:hypothetical protein